MPGLRNQAATMWPATHTAAAFASPTLGAWEEKKECTACFSRQQLMSRKDMLQVKQMSTNYTTVICQGRHPQALPDAGSVKTGISSVPPHD
jgi:hypothetical protein